jgi:hypothetical protein
VTNRAIAHARLRNSRLVGPPLGSAAEVVRWFGAVQSQDVPGALWAVAQRMDPATTMADVAAALDGGEIVRTHAMRPTWHFLVPEDLRWIQALTGDRVARLNGTLQRRLGVSAVDLDRGVDVLREAMRGGRALTRDEVRSTLAAAGFDMTDTLMSVVIGMAAEVRAVIVNGPRRGKQPTFTLVDDWVAPAPLRSRDDSLRELAVRYFQSHGPALVADMAWWSGLTRAETRRAIELAGPALEERQVDGTAYWSLAGAFDPSDGLVPAPWVRLLSNYDEYLGSYTDYSPVFDPALPKARNVADVLGAHIVVRDGMVVGGWRRAFGPKRNTVTVTLLLDLTPAERRALEAEAEAYARFLGGPVDLIVGRE